MYNLKNLKETFFWNITSMSTDVKERILKECTLQQISYFFELILTFFGTISVLYLWLQDAEKYCTLSILLVKLFGHDIAICLHYVMAFYILHSSIAMASGTWFCHYMMFYLKFQIWMLQDFISRTNKKHLKKCFSITDNKYHQNMGVFLDFIVDRHQSLVQ